MLLRLFAILLVVVGTQTAAEAKRVALLIGQDAYPGGKSATVGLATLKNSGNDVRKVATLLGKHGFEVLSCDGPATQAPNSKAQSTPEKQLGCFDLDRVRLLKALNDLTEKAKGADTALVYFAGHGMASEAGNILTPIDAKVNCATGAIAQGVEVERFMAATAGARHKLVILDACRNNPIGEVCPGLKGKKLSFTRIEAGAMQGLLLVTSTQFGQEALDGEGAPNSPFATALVASLELNPGIYFEQVMNEVGRATYQAAMAPTTSDPNGFQQIPGKIVGTPAPDDCLTGKNCVGDPRMAALAVENEKLTADASAVRNILADEERRRGKLYTPEERQAAVERIGKSLTSLAGSAEPKVQEASRLFSAGKVAEGDAKLDEALDDDAKAAAEIERLGKERRKILARNARDAAGLARGRDIAKALARYEIATRYDPEHVETWIDYGEVARDVGRTDEAKRAFEQAANQAKDDTSLKWRVKALYRQSDMARVQGNLAGARRLAESALELAGRRSRAAPNDLDAQRELSVSQVTFGDVLVAQGNVPAALDAFKASLAISELLANADPRNAGWQRDLSISHEIIGDMHRAQGNLAAAIDAFKASLAISKLLAKADPGNAGYQRDLSVSHIKIGDVLRAQGNLPQALEAYDAAIVVAERLAKADSANAGWQRDLSISHDRIGSVLERLGRLDEAMLHYAERLAIAERLAKHDPSNVTWQQDVETGRVRMERLKGKR